MANKSSGLYISQGDYKAFIPSHLPPVPLIKLEGDVNHALEEAHSTLIRLDGIVSSLPNSDLFIAMYVRKEALLSAQIEGTQASLEDVFDVEAGASVGNLGEVTDVINYIKALHYGIEKLDELPMSLRLIKELHHILLDGTRGNEKAPGEFRRSQNWIGPAGCTLFTASFVPPPPHMVIELMGTLENYIHESNSGLHPLIDCALIHYQFETIHPFLDGNGRLGRLLITFYLLWKKTLSGPLLYLSYYLKLHRQEYYDRLSMVRTTGNYEQWILFFLKGVEATSKSGIKTIARILQLQEDTQTLLITHNISIHGIKLLHHLFYTPILTISDAQAICDISFQGASTLIKELEQIGILHEITGRKRAKRYAFKEYLALLSEGTQPL